MIRVLVIVLVLSLAAGLAPPAGAADLSADMVILQGAQTVDMMKIYISGRNARTEMTKTGSVGISRPDRGVVWVLYPQQRQYMEKPADATSAVQNPGVDPPGVVKKEKIGADSVSGYSCTKYRLTLGMPGGRQTTALSCVADALGVAVRMEVTGLVSELRNIKPGAQPANLFEIPAGYQLAASQVPSDVRLPSNLPSGMAEKMRQALGQRGASGQAGAAERSSSASGGGRDPGAVGTLPAWLPAMPGCTPRVSGNERSGGAGMNCTASPEEVAAWYEAALRKNGFEVKKSGLPAAGRPPMFNLRAFGSGVQVAGNVGRNVHGRTGATFSWLPGK